MHVSLMGSIFYEYYDKKFIKLKVVDFKLAFSIPFSLFQVQLYRSLAEVLK